MASNHRIKGVYFALAACFVWGLIFVVPQFMKAFTPLEIALGRYFFYGIVSLLFFCKMVFRGDFSFSFRIWFKAFYFSLFLTIIYYTCVVLSFRHATPAMAALLLGLAPMTIAFYGNWRQKECDFKSLIFPSVSVCLGLAIMNVPEIIQSDCPKGYIVGLLYAATALVIWSWYVVANAQFLKEYPDISSSNWATLVGVATLAWVFLVATLLFVFLPNEFPVSRYLTVSSEMKGFFIGSAILGVVCAWLGGFLWNKACLFLPVSLAGQITLAETVFGLVFIYLLERRIPSYADVLGILLFFVALTLAIRRMSKKPAYVEKTG